MMQYTNRYFGAYNMEKQEIILTFFQESPTPTLLPTGKDDGIQELPPSDVRTEEIANLVMSRSSAEKLVELIQGLLNAGSAD